MSRLTVVKLGGSHAFAAHLPHWIAAIAAHAGKVVVVPGGGIFADAVREAQPRMGFDESAAHIMAMLAMAQYGYAVAGLSRHFTVVDNLDDLKTTVGQRRIPVWTPMPMALHDPDIVHSWTVTSDSLALWLARKLDAERFIAVKQRLPAADLRSPGQLSKDGLVDDAFAGMYHACPLGNWIAGPDHFTSLDPLFAGRPHEMVRICLAQPDLLAHA